MGDHAPRSRCSEDSESDQDRAGRRGPRRCRIILIIAGGLLGPGYWLCGSLWDGQVFGKSPTQIRFTEFVIASVVVVVASWGLLLILGEALLFALAVFKADDRERYDIYRNLMILWGYVLTLGIPRHFRKLPAQFGALPDDARSRGRAGGGAGQAGRRDGGHRRPGTEANTGRTGSGRPQERSSARDRTGSQQRGPRTDGGGRQAGEGAQGRAGSPETNLREQSASLGSARESAPPLGPIFPPRPAAEAEVVPASGPSVPGPSVPGPSVPGPSVAGAPVPGAPVAVTTGSVAAPAAVAPPSGESELRDALDLLMRYAARFGAGEAVTPRPTGAEPGPPFGIVAEAGGDP